MSELYPPHFTDEEIVVGTGTGDLGRVGAAALLVLQR